LLIQNYAVAESRFCGFPHKKKSVDEEVAGLTGERRQINERERMWKLNDHFS